MSHKDELILPGVWDIIPTLLSIFLLQVKPLPSLQVYKYHKYAIHSPVLFCLN